MSWFTETGFGYLFGVAAVTLISVVLFYRGLWGDRSKGRVRCPKCFYDMRGTVPKLECPECGHDARQERRLHKHHRHWGRTSIGVLRVLLSAHPLHIVGGWWREQAVMWAYGIDANAIYQWDIRTAWLAFQLPDRLRRFYRRIDHLCVDPAEIAACRSLWHLSEVDLTERASDADLVHRQGMSKLEYLGLWGTQVTDAGLLLLRGLPNLESLFLMEDTLLTDADMAELRKALPNIDLDILSR